MTHRSAHLAVLIASLVGLAVGFGGCGGTNNLVASVTPTVASVTVAPASPSIAVGATEQFTATAKDASGNVITGTTFAWTSTTPATATIGASSGLATAVAVGTTAITASAGGVTSAADALTVTAPVVASVTVAPAAPSITVGATEPFTATAKDAGGATIAGVTFTWASATPGVATINAATGVATGVSVGTSAITAQAGAITSAADTLTVTAPPVASVTVNPASPTIAVGATQQFTATAKDAGGNVIAGATFTWASATPGVATIGASTGLATGVATGTSAITAQSGTVTSAADTLTVQTATSVTGTAASGAPLGALTVTLKDANGVSRTSTTGVDGTFTLNSTGLTPPFFLQIQPASGNPFYSVSADANATTIINLDPLTDLIIRSWYGALGVSVDAAFAAPASNPPPTPPEVQLLSNLYLQMMALWLGNNGVDISNFNLISTPFVANGAGVDKVLDETTVNVDTGAVTVTDGTTTQASTVTYATASATVSINTTTTGPGGTSNSMISTAVPAQSAQAVALAGVTATLNAVAATITAKGAALADTDLLPFIAADLLNDGLNQEQWAASMATQFRGQAVTLQAASIASLDTTDGIADINLGASVALGGGAFANQQVEFQFKQVDGSWLMYGDQLLGAMNVRAAMQTNQGTNTSGGNGPVISIDAQPDQGKVGGITVTGGGVFTNAPFTASGTVLDQFMPTPTTTLDVTYDHFVINTQPLTTTTLVPAGTPFTLTLALLPSGTATVVEKSNAFTTEPVTFTGQSSSALSSISFGTPMTFHWTLPTTYAVETVKITALLFDGDQANPATVQCEADGPFLAANATSGAIAIPATCNGAAVTQVNINLSVVGVNGERSNAIFYFQ